MKEINKYVKNVLALLDEEDFFDKAGKKESFFTSPGFFDKLAGTDQLRKQMLAGLSEKEIRASWQPALNKYKALRKKYLIYR